MIVGLTAVHQSRPRLGRHLDKCNLFLPSLLAELKAPDDGACRHKNGQKMIWQAWLLGWFLLFDCLKGHQECRYPLTRLGRGTEEERGCANQGEGWPEPGVHIGHLSDMVNGQTKKTCIAGGTQRPPTESLSNR